MPGDLLSSGSDHWYMLCSITSCKAQWPLCLQLRQEGEEVSTSSDNSETDSEDDGAEGGGDRMQCQTS